MFDNPFSPVFGGRPELFFGRNEILQSFYQAMPCLASFVLRPREGTSALDTARHGRVERSGSTMP